MAVTMKDIAFSAGVSKATVSKVLNGADQHISAQTRTRIMELVKEMGYVPNQVARGLKIKQTRMMGFLLPDISNPFFPEIARGIETAAKEHGFGVVMCNTNDTAEEEYESFKFLSAKMVDGIIFTRSMRRGNLDRVFSSGIPIVVVDREVDGAQFGCGQVFVDTREGIRRSTEVLLEAGCRRLAFISAEYYSGCDRFDGYKQALSEAGVTFEPELVYKAQYNVETGYEGMNAILSLRDVDGCVCGNDLIAIGAMNALKERGISVPEQVKVMGFDDIYFAKYTTPALSTIRQPAYEIGVRAASMLAANLLYGQPLTSEKLDFEVKLRGTV